MRKDSPNNEKASRARPEYVLGGYDSCPARMRILLVLQLGIMYDFKIDGDGGEEGQAYICEGQSGREEAREGDGRGEGDCGDEPGRRISQGVGTVESVKQCS